MKTPVLALLAALLLPACAHGAGGVVWREVAHCGPSPVDLGGTVVQDLMQDDAGALLDDLALKYGPDLIACLVDDGIAALTRHGAEASPEAVAGAQRGRSYLAARGVKQFDRSQEPKE